MSGVPTALEQSRAAAWSAAAFRTDGSLDATSFPVSFRYGGQDSAALLSDWLADWTTAAADTDSGRGTLRLVDPNSGLRCRVEVTTFADFPTVEWVASFRNDDLSKTPILSDLQP